MPVRKQHSSAATVYFTTFTCYEWLPLFALTNSYDLIYKWFQYLKDSKGIQVTGYVIMPNHLHAILFFPKEDYNLNRIIANAKRFIPAWRQTGLMTSLKGSRRKITSRHFSNEAVLYL